MNKELIIKEFSLKNFGSKGWMRGDLHCPECGHSDKFGIIFDDKGGVANCMRCSISLPLGKVLRDIGRKDLLSYEESFQVKNTLPSLRLEKLEKEESEVLLPIRLMPVKYNDYLDSRGFTIEQYIQFHVMESTIDPQVRDKLVFLIYQRGILRGWLARSTKSKDWHKQNLKQFKEGTASLELRYRNSENDFSKLLGGLDEITSDTHTLILVEGLFDKANTDRVLELNNKPEIKCCFTFGDDISNDQVDLIPDTVDTVILMYDPGALKNMKNCGGRLLTRFDTQVAPIYGDKDPGDMNIEEFNKSFNSMTPFLDFYTEITI